MRPDKAWATVLGDRLGQPLFASGSEVRFNCFRNDCGNSGEKDSHYHMYVNTDKGKYFCQKCQRGGTLEWLAEFLGVTPPEDNLSLWNEVINDFLFGSKEEKAVEAPVEQPEMMDLVPGTTALRYLSERGISQLRIRAFDIKMGIGKLRNRVVFPDYSDSGELEYWVARDYVGRDPKYRNSKSPRVNKIYNSSRWIRCQRFSQVIICEGVISSIVTGYDTVATYGKYVTGGQVERLCEMNADTYVVAFDGDAVAEAISLASRLCKRGKCTKIVKFPYDKDPADLGCRETRSRVREASKFSNPFDAVKVML